MEQAGNISAQERLGRSVRAFRARNGINKVDFCNTVRMSRPTLDLIESGRGNVTLKTLERMAAAMGTDPWELIR